MGKNQDIFHCERMMHRIQQIDRWLRPTVLYYSVISALQNPVCSVLLRLRCHRTGDVSHGASRGVYLSEFIIYLKTGPWTCYSIYSENIHIMWNRKSEKPLLYIFRPFILRSPCWDRKRKHWIKPAIFPFSGWHCIWICDVAINDYIWSKFMTAHLDEKCPVWNWLSKYK